MKLAVGTEVLVELANVNSKFKKTGDLREGAGIAGIVFSLLSLKLWGSRPWICKEGFLAEDFFVHGSTRMSTDWLPCGSGFIHG